MIEKSPLSATVSGETYLDPIRLEEGDRKLASLVIKRVSDDLYNDNLRAAFSSWIRRESPDNPSEDKITGYFGRDYLATLKLQANLQQDSDSLVARKIGVLMPTIVQGLAPSGELPAKEVVPMLVSSLRRKLAI